MSIDEKIIEGIQQQNAYEIIKKLQNGRKDTTEVDTCKKQLDVFKHDVMSLSKRPDKKVVVDTESGTKEVKFEPVARIGLAFQKLITERVADLTFGTPALYNCDTDNEAEKRVYEAVKRVLAENKIDSHNINVARELYSVTEAAELWWLDEKQHDTYGFPTSYKLKVSMFTPKNGDLLYPYFDERGRMIAFSRLFSTREFGETDTTTFFETYTANYHYLWRGERQGFKLVEGYPKTNVIGKIPVVYGCQRYPEWHEVQPLIERLEKVLSNLADTNDYTASPKLIVTGQINGWAQKGECGAIIECDENAKCEYLSLNNAPENVKLEIEQTLRFIHQITRIPDISFDNIKGTNASGVALELLFSDSHQKINGKRDIWDDYLYRRVSVIKAILKQLAISDKAFASACDTCLITPELVPYKINDEQSTISNLLAATGQKPIMSVSTAVKALNYTNNPDAELERINDDAAAASMQESMSGFGDMGL